MEVGGACDLRGIHFSEKSSVDLTHILPAGGGSEASPGRMVSACGHTCLQFMVMGALGGLSAQASDVMV